MSKTLYFYGQTVPKNKKQKSKRVTVAGIVDENTTVSSIRIGVAICSTKDQFSKVKGRTISTGRALSSKPYSFMKSKSDSSVKDFISYAKKIISEEL